jgi:hypothetical protein
MENQDKHVVLRLVDVRSFDQKNVRRFVDERVHLGVIGNFIDIFDDFQLDFIVKHPSCVDEPI